MDCAFRSDDSCALVAAAGGTRWLVAAYRIALSPVSLVAVVAAPEMTGIDIADAGPSGAQ